jgi:hypothetical protein
MRLVFLPTLFDLQTMLGNQTYVDFVWMWRDRERETHSRERLEKWLAKMPQREVESRLRRVPTPIVRAVSEESQGRPEIPAVVDMPAVASTVAALPLKPQAVHADLREEEAAPSAAAFPAVLEYPHRGRARRVASPAPF